jgi:hypothetical protein
MTTISAKSILASQHNVTSDRVDTLLLRYTHPEEHCNFKGFRQYRKMLPGECR